MSPVVYEDLFDIEKQPGAGVALWTKAVEMQLERVRDANYRHRLHNSPNEDEKREDPSAVSQLEADVYFLALAVRRVLLFHDAVAKQLQDPRLAEARKAFTDAAPHAKVLRDFYEHLDKYLLDDPGKHKKEIRGRVAPVLLSRWDSDNVVVAFGPLRVDITRAGVAALELGRKTEAVYSEHSARAKAEHFAARRNADEGHRIIEVKMGVSTVIGGEDEDYVAHTGTLLDVLVREATPDEIAQAAQPASKAKRDLEP